LGFLERENDISIVYARLETNTQISDLDEPKEVDEDEED